MTWKASVYSAIGVRHQRIAQPCQDYGEFRLVEDIVIGVVSDGAGSAKLSDIGSKVAVERMLTFLGNFKAWLTKHSQKKKGLLHRFLAKESMIPERVMKKIFQKGIVAVLQSLQEEAVKQNCQLQDLACTLLVFVATPEWTGVMQIGDGFIVGKLPDQNLQLLLQPDKGEFINETTFVTSSNAFADMQVKVIAGRQDFICASTDGLEKVAIRLSDWHPHTPFFTPLEEYVRETENPESDNQYLRDFLESERLNARTDDDKTLLLCVWENAASDVNISA